MWNRPCRFPIDRGIERRPDRYCRQPDHHYPERRPGAFLFTAALCLMTGAAGSGEEGHNERPSTGPSLRGRTVAVNLGRIEKLLRELPYAQRNTIKTLRSPTLSKEYALPGSAFVMETGVSPAQVISEKHSCKSPRRYQDRRKEIQTALT